MGYEGFSMTGDNEEMTARIREAALKQEQMQELEQAIKSKSESEVEGFVSDLKEQNNLSDIEADSANLKGRLESDAESKARDAIKEKMEKHLNSLSDADDNWEAHINNFGIASWITRLFR